MKRRYETVRPFHMLGLILQQSGASLIVQPLHEPHIHVPDVVQCPAHLSKYKCRSEGKTLCFRQIVHRCNVKRTGLSRKLLQLHIWNPSKDARADCLFLQPGQMVEKLAVILSRGLLWFPLQPVPRTLGLVFDPGQHDSQSFSRRRIEPIANQRLILSIGHGPGVLRGPMESGERRKLEPLPDQLLQRHIDDIGEIFQRPRGILARALHRLLSLVAPGLDPRVIANQEHVPATGRTGTVTEQIFGD
ncbi:MAG TPA: hypothetical protein VK578_14850 [Edaphobacter sp.]|nr:hypothetical protein [Edaphobacter sp.]